MSIVFIRDVSTGESREELCPGEKKEEKNQYIYAHKAERERERERVNHNKRICSPSTGAASRQIESLNPCTRMDKRIKTYKPKA